MKKAANDAIRTNKKYRRNKGIRIWNEENSNAIAKKQTAYQIYQKTLVKYNLKHTK
jgi:ribosomal protein L14